MAKDPAILFYTADFLTGTQFFSDEQVGKYIRLLCAQHLHGRLPLKHMLHICKTQDEDIFEKFSQDEAGNYYNVKLEEVIDKRKAYSASRANNRAGATKKFDSEVVTGKKSLTKNKKNIYDICETHVEHMENENINENINKNRTESIEERAKNFEEDARVYVDEYGERLVNKFVNYWTERSPRGVKMKFEKEATFDIKRRLDTFQANEEKWFGKKGGVGPSSTTDRTQKLLKKYGKGS